MAVQVVEREESFNDDLSKVDISAQCQSEVTHIVNEDRIVKSGEEGQKTGLGLKAACERSPHLCSWVLTIISYPLVILFVHGLIMMPVNKDWRLCAILSGCALGIMLLFHLYEISVSDSKGYLWNSYKKEDFEKFLDFIGESHPTIEWHMECSHEYTEMVDDTDEDGNVTGQHAVTRTVVTHTAKEFCNIKSSSDISEPVVGLDEFNFTMLNVGKKFVFKNEASESNYNIQKSRFKQGNSRDRRNIFWEKFDIPGYESRMLCHDFKSYGNDSSLCIGYQFFVIFHLLLLGPCFQITVWIAGDPYR